MTLREFISTNTLSDEQMKHLRTACADLARGRQEQGGEIPGSLERSLSEGMTRYGHHQDLLRFIERNCAKRLDTPMTNEDTQQLASIGANVFELTYFIPR